MTYQKTAGPKENTAKFQQTDNQMAWNPSSFAGIATNSLQFLMETRQITNTLVPMYVLPSTPTTISLISETSIRSSISSIKPPYVSVMKMEETPSLYQKLVIPFSGFTEADVKEITGGKEPKSKRRGSALYNSSTNPNPNDPRPVLKRCQSEKRKSSYERYVQESLENFLQKRNNTEESSYNTVLAVKMMVNPGGSIVGEKVSIAIDEDQTGGNNSKDTMYITNSNELLSARLDRIMNPPSSDNSLTQITQQEVDAATRSTATATTAECSKSRSKWMSLRKELDQLEKEYVKIQSH